MDQNNNPEVNHTVQAKLDKTFPLITESVDIAPASTGWYNENTGAPTALFECSDLISGIEFCEPDHAFDEGLNQAFTGHGHDFAGNSSSVIVDQIYVDLTDPEITWAGSIINGDSFYFGSVPSAPTCTASDILSGPGSCSVSGYSTLVGTHTLTGIAYDVAGNEKYETLSYTVIPWTMIGFYSPIDMVGVWNTVKGGATVPLKFNVFNGSTEITDPSNVNLLQAYLVTCSTGYPEDQIELTSTGNTSLRYSFGDWFLYLQLENTKSD